MSTEIEIAAKPERQPRPLHELLGIDDYIQDYGPSLCRRAIDSLDPLHVPGRDALIDFAEVVDFNPKRTPFPAQAHVITGAVEMMRESGSGFIAAEMGTGKTILSIISFHEHAKLSRKKGGRGGKYRAMVLCPDHLVAKWEREIIETIPNVTVRRFDDWKGVVGLIGGHTDRKRLPNGVVQDKRRWPAPDGPEWYVIGRDQAKWYPEWRGISDPAKGREHGLTRHTIAANKRPRKDAMGKLVKDENGKVLHEHDLHIAHRCPTCGSFALDKRGELMSEDAISKEKRTCQARYLRQIARPDRKGQNGLDTIPLPALYRQRQTGSEVNHGGSLWEIRECREPLWNFVRKPYKWAPAHTIQRKLRRMFQYLAIDEVHEQKSDESARSMAASKMISSAQHVLALTGTLIGGYADHIFPLLMRICPRTLKHESFEWGKDMAFSEIYGRIDRVVTTKEGDSDTSVSKRTKSMRKAKTGKASVKKYVKPGIQPPLFGTHLMGHAIFLTLEELSNELPDLYEYVGGSPPEPTEFNEELLEGWHDTACDMTYEQEAEYRRITGALEVKCRELLQRGSTKLLGTYLWTSLDYPDRPYGWGPSKDLLKAIEAANDKDSKGDDGKDGLLGQSFLSNFDARCDPDAKTLTLTKLVSGETETVPVKRMGGVWLVDVSINGHVKSLIYDTGAADVSLSLKMASECGWKKRKGDHEGRRCIADGSVVPVLESTLDSVAVGRFAVETVGCSIGIPPTPHTVGFWKEPKLYTEDNWEGVVTPKDLDESVVYPKEQALIDICKREHEAGNQTWVYVQMTGKRNIQPRLKELLEKEGLRVGILKTGDVKPIDREKWIEDHGQEFDVMISFPGLVSTGLDFFSKKEGGHNYSTIVFYQTGYNPFTMRQAARRAWRISQPKDCRIYYLYYNKTMQHRAMALMSKKIAAAQQLEGEFSADGLAAMAEDDNLSTALAKSMSEQVDDADMRRNWEKTGVKKVRSGKKVKAKADEIKLPVDLVLAIQGVVDGAGADMGPVTGGLAKPAVPALTIFDDGDEWTDEDMEIPDITEDMLMRMFANMAQGVA